MNRQGQALIEWAILTPLFVTVLLGLFAFGQWFLVREELLMIAKEGAFLYSSGRLPNSAVQRVMSRRARRGYPRLPLRSQDIYIGRDYGVVTNLLELDMKLDRVSVTYRPTQILLRYFSKAMEETCIIKHAAHYGPPLQKFLGPPVPS